MSFILDALKKADEARHPAAAASSGKIRVPRLAPRRARWPWVLAVAALVVMNAALVAYLMWPTARATTALSREGPTAPRPAPATTARPPDVVPAARPPGADAAASRAEPTREQAVPPPRSTPSVATPAEPARRAEPNPGPVEATRLRTPVAPPPKAASSPETQDRRGPAPRTSLSATPGSPAATAPAAPPVAAAPARPPSAEPARVEPTRPGAAPAASLAPVAGDDEIAKLKVTVHVWADRAAERLVFINGRKYVQGDRVEDKVLVEEITPEGAVVSYQGRRSLLRP